MHPLKDIIWPFLTEIYDLGHSEINLLTIPLLLENAHVHYLAMLYILSTSLLAVKHILAALNGDTAGIAEEGIALGGGTNVCTPGKLDAGKAIYGSDGKGGGCAIFKTKETVTNTKNTII